MGFSLSWIAIHSVSKREAIALIGCSDTGESDAYRESPISAAELSNGWSVIVLRDVSHKLSTSKSITELSRGGRTVLACQVEEHVMGSAAYLAHDGKKLWDVTHESERGIYDLLVHGQVPDALEAIHARLKSKQDEDGGEEADVDYIFDVPVELAQAIAGFRHDQDGDVGFTKLAQLNA